MGTILILVVSVFYLTCSSCTNAAECENGWVAYKDEQCIQYFPDLLPYMEAKDLCLQKSASPVMVKEPELQELIANYTKDIFDNLWLGGRYDNQTEEFKWEDGTPITYANWHEGYPKNNTDSCLEFRPQDSKASIMDAGKWADVACQKRNGIICQKELSWSLKDAVNEIIRLRKQLTTELEVIRSTIVPVGSIYIEYSAQANPQTLWPSLTWQDVTSLYAGLFFRALGGTSESWGTVQADCARKITAMEYTESSSVNPWANPMYFPSSGWSSYGWAGYNFMEGPSYYEALRFYVEDCEARPKNQAIRLWKRIA